MPNRTWIGFSLGVISLLLSIWGSQSFDWASVGEPELPLHDEVLDNSVVTIKELRIGNEDVIASPPTFTPYQYVNMSLVATSKPGTFRVAKGFVSRRTEEEQKLPGVSIRCELVRRSSLGDGMARVNSVGLAARIDENGELTWKSQVWIPQAPGKYRARIILVTQLRKNSGERETSLSTIASFPITVAR